MNKKHLSIALSSLLALPLLAPAGTAPTAFAEGADQEVVIVYKNADGKEAAIEQSEEVQHEFKTVPAVAATVSSEDLRDLVDNPDIDYVERNISFQTTDFETTSYTPPATAKEAGNWNYQQVAPNTMWDQGFTGNGVKIAVVDSGISEHPELKIAGGISTVGDGTNANYADDNGHGTHVAGIIAADSGQGNVVGMAPGASLYAVKTLGADGKGTLVDLLEGLDWAIQNNMDIINLSLGGDTDAQSLHDMVDKAYNKGILVVASAGNSGTADNQDQNTVGYPARYDSVISVASVDQNLNHSEFSSAGPRVDVSAPGEVIRSTFPIALGVSYKYMSGTSQAAPHVAGELALLKEKNPSANASQLREILNGYALDRGTPGRDNLYGSGVVTFKPQIDSSAPAEVGNAVVSAAATDSLTLSWTQPTDRDFKEVRVYSGSEPTFTTVTQSTYQALNLAPDTAYDFRLTTVDTAGNESQGVPVSGRTLAASVSGSPSTGETPVTAAPTQQQPVQPTPAPTVPEVISAPFVPTPAPSGGSAQIPSGGGGAAPIPSGGGGGGGAAAPAAAAPAAAPVASPSVPAAVPAKSPTPAPAATTPNPSPSVPSTVAPTTPVSVSIPFQDVPSTFWGRDTVAWAFERGLVKGYADGQFKPGATVTESEFLAMLIRAFEPNVKNSTTGTWSNTYYARAKQLGLPTKGNASKASRSQTITRVQVAEMLASANGRNLKGNQAIQYLLSAGIASGSSKTSKTVASFKGNASLTRAEALQFIKNLTEKGNGSLS
ncbi:S8 family serine peptidase [Saccharibacillus endophyticus]|uniref:S8 family serine peptidase n=1 Tax=Saccharibacillus endophyticus TaxID=2060666 RepID=A0ABQ1ZU29_9BACL|nr:S8 family serine peptidase [Saccharibacillus endophyticus]GGH79377.1 hypothetical protein GCM10007362_26080 [Saccharibacillus endophyticus]